MSIVGRFIFGTLLLVLTGAFAFAAEKPNAWPYWLNSSGKGTVTVSYQPWNLFLKKYVVKATTGNNLVKYSAVTKNDRRRLYQFIDYMSRLNPLNMSKNEQFAYWVNFYNALTVQLILKNYPIASITKLGGFFHFGPWDEKIVSVNGKKLSLNDIEHRILRPGWKDKRIHYVVNCASLGCPNLQPEAFSPEHINKQLDQAAEEYINLPKGVEVKGEEVVLSKIYDWYLVDFGNRKSLISHLVHYLKNPATISALENPNVKIAYRYNWSLNQYIK